MVAPTTVEHVSELVSGASSRGRTIRMIGSGHSFTATAIANDIMLTPGSLASVRSIDPRTGLATVDAGIDLATLCTALDNAGLALTNMGDICAQTLAGAIQTGTHGTGRNSGTFAGMVQALEIVIADGSVVVASPTENSELFDAARVGLGAFGIITAITVAVEPAFRLRAEESPASFDEAMASFDDWSASHDHVEFFWFPHTQACLVKRNDRTYDPPIPLTGRRGLWDGEFLSSSKFGALCRLGRTAPGYVKALNRMSTRTLSGRSYTDDSWKVFTSPRKVRFAEMEYNLPREALLPALREVKKLLDEGPWRITFPVLVRSVPADDSWLSPAFERASGYIAVHAFDRTDRDWFSAVEDIMRAHQGRPHWGTLHSREAQDLRPEYPNWDRCLEIRQLVDPERTFANDYTRRVLGL